MTFLKKAKLVLTSGQITRATIILLGRSESEYYLSPGVSKIAWILKDHRREPKDYLIVTCPMLLGVEKIYEKIRNLKYRYLVPGTLEQEEIDTYDPYLIREAIHNCIAHSNYERAGRVNIVEYEDRLVFSNLGSFIPESVENVIRQNAPAEYYRNRFLVEAMVNLNMVDTIGRGICKMFESQRIRAFPMPEYRLSQERTELTIIGKVLNLDYARLLTSNEDLTLLEVYYLDKLQKGQPLTPEEIKILKSKHLIEGRNSRYCFTKTLSELNDQPSESDGKPALFDKQDYFDFILNALKEQGQLSRQQINHLLMDKLSSTLTELQKIRKVGNLLNELKKEGKITSVGKTNRSMWTLKLN